MSKLEKTLTALNRLEYSSSLDCFMHDVDPRAKLLVTLAYLIAVLSFSLHALAPIILFAIYPVLASSLSAVSYTQILRKSLYVLPFIAFIGIFNPIYHTSTDFTVGGVDVSYGWVEFISICVRGLLAVQVVLLLIMTTGFYGICRALSALGLPSIFSSQLLLIYRYIFVLVQEALSMERARKARSYGRKTYSLRMYGIFVGQLLLRTVERARHIYNAMESRGFDGSIPISIGHTSRWHTRDTLFLIIWIALFLAGRFLNVDAIFS